MLQLDYSDVIRCAVSAHVLHGKLAEHVSSWEDAVNTKQENSVVWLKVQMQTV